MTRLILKFLIPLVIILLLLKSVRRVRTLERMKAAVHFDYYFHRILLAFGLLAALLLALIYVMDHIGW